MPAAEFRAQQYCRAELKDFEFNARYDIVGATVYFTGTNFSDMKSGTITSSSLLPIKGLMDLCKPGTVVVFDDVRVIGPDKEIRTIPGVTYLLY